MANDTNLTPYEVIEGEDHPPGFSGYGWYGLNDFGNLEIGPYPTREECEEAIRSSANGRG